MDLSLDVDTWSKVFMHILSVVTVSVLAAIYCAGGDKKTRKGANAPPLNAENVIKHSKAGTGGGNPAKEASDKTKTAEEMKQKTKSQEKSAKNNKDKEEKASSSMENQVKKDESEKKNDTQSNKEKKKSSEVDKTLPNSEEALKKEAETGKTSDAPVKVPSVKAKPENAKKAGEDIKKSIEDAEALKKGNEKAEKDVKIAGGVFKILAEGSKRASQKVPNSEKGRDTKHAVNKANKDAKNIEGDAKQIGDAVKSTEKGMNEEKGEAVKNADSKGVISSDDKGREAQFKCSLDPAEVSWNKTKKQQVIKLTNNYDKQIAIKVMCSNIEVYEIEPIFASCAPSGVTQVKVDRIQETRKPDKMVILVYDFSEGSAKTAEEACGIENNLLETLTVNFIIRNEA